jgi:hypothetical protein
MLRSRPYGNRLPALRRRPSRSARSRQRSSRRQRCRSLDAVQRAACRRKFEIVELAGLLHFLTTHAFMICSRGRPQFAQVPLPPNRL